MKRNDYGYVSRKSGPVYHYQNDEDMWQRAKWYVIPAVILTIILGFVVLAHAQVVAPAKTLIASWYSIQSLKTEGTYKYSKGVMANGKQFKDEALTCATRLYPLGTRIKVTNVKNGRSVVVEVTDRISKRFANTRIDLSKGSFKKIGSTEAGLISVRVEVITREGK